MRIMLCAEMKRLKSYNNQQLQISTKQLLNKMKTTTHIVNRYPGSCSGHAQKMAGLNHKWGQHLPFTYLYPHSVYNVCDYMYVKLADPSQLCFCF